MKIVSVAIENFLAIRSAYVKLEDRGLVLIQGENLDDPSSESNGSGKSSIPDAICWAIYGKTARGVTGDAVVNLFAKANCGVIVNIQDDKNLYRIFRGRKRTGDGNFLKLFEADASSKKKFLFNEITKGTEKETQALINSIMGCSLDIFMASIYAGQERMPDLPGMTDKMLKLIVEEAAGLEKIESAYQVANHFYQDNSNDLNKDIRLFKEIKGLIDKELSRIKNYKDEKEERKIKKQKELNVKKILLNDYKGAIAANKDTVDTFPDHDELVKRIDSINQQIIDLSSASEEQRKLKDQITEHHYRIRIREKSIEDILTEVLNSESLIKKLDDKEEIPCSECGRPYETRAEIEEAKRKLTELIDKLNEEMEEHGKFIKNQEFLIKGKKSKLVKGVEGNREKIDDLNEEKDRLNKSISEIASIKKYIEADEVQAAKLDAEIGVLMEDLATDLYKEFIDSSRQLIDDYRGRLKDIGDRIIKGKNTEKIGKAVIEILGRKGIRKYIIDQITPYLNDRTAEYLNALSDGCIKAEWNTLSLSKSGELKENFKIEVTNDKGANSFSGLSGGEKRKVRLATTMALQDLIASRATKSIDLFIADEVDHALDESGLERLMSILNTKAKEKGSVFVISHNSLSDWIDNVITVKKEKGYSVIT